MNRFITLPPAICAAVKQLPPPWISSRDEIQAVSKLVGQDLRYLHPIGWCLGIGMSMPNCLPFPLPIVERPVAPETVKIATPKRRSAKKTRQRKRPRVVRQSIDAKPISVTRQLPVVPDPTLEQISQRAAEIRRGWNASTRRSRLVSKPRAYNIPTVPTAELIEVA